MNKDMRQEELKQMVLMMPWTLPSEDPDVCHDYIMTEVNGYRMELRHFRNKGCECFSGISVRVEHKSAYNDRFTLTVIEAKPFSGYKAFDKWYKATKKRLLKELEERIEERNYSKFKSLFQEKTNAIANT